MPRNKFILTLFMMVVAVALSSCKCMTCDSIRVKSQVFGPTAGSTTLCVKPTECREDTMTTLVGTEQCRKTDNDCGKGDRSCPAEQLCKAEIDASDPGLVVTEVSWNRDKPCEKPAGTNECTAKWKIPEKTALHCACGCTSK